MTSSETLSETLFFHARPYLQGKNDGHLKHCGAHSCHIHASELHTPFFPKIWAREKFVETFKVKWRC